MTKEVVLKELREDEANENGQILTIEDTGVLYYDYETEDTFYRFAEACTKEEIQKCMYISETAQKRGITKDILWDVINEAFRGYVDDAVCTLNGLFIVSNEEDYEKFLDEVNTHTALNLNEWYEWESIEDNCGMMLYVAKIAVINENVIYKMSLELGDDLVSPEEEYSIGIVQTVIHELRHLMLETNCFFPEEIASIEENAEDAVEEFCRNAYENLSDYLKVLDVSLAIPKEESFS